MGLIRRGRWRAARDDGNGGAESQKRPGPTVAAFTRWHPSCSRPWWPHDRLPLEFGERTARRVL